jgi:hypothetical protein
MRSPSNLCLRYRTRDTVVQNWLPLEVRLEIFYPVLTTEFLASTLPNVVGQEDCPQVTQTLGVSESPRKFSVNHYVKIHY